MEKYSKDRKVVGRHYGLMVPLLAAIIISVGVLKFAQDHIYKLIALGVFCVAGVFIAFLTDKMANYLCSHCGKIFYGYERVFVSLSSLRCVTCGDEKDA